MSAVTHGTSASLVDIARLLESTQLKTIAFFISKDQDATQQFVSTLEQKKSSVQELPTILQMTCPGQQRLNVCQHQAQFETQ
jgi:hypothetical protein